MKKAYFEINGMKYTLEFRDTETAKKVYEQLPFAGNVQRWGDEIYFDVPITGVELEDDAREIMKIGEVGFWVQGSAVAIFFGPTPASQNDEPRAMEPINVFAKVVGDISALKEVNSDAFIYLTNA